MGSRPGHWADTDPCFARRETSVLDRSRLAIIIPAFNEARSITRVVESVKPLGVVIVVDDASNDGTSERAEQAGALIVQHPQNRGYDAALQSGFRQAAVEGVDFAITMDADGQHTVAGVGSIASALAEGDVLVVGIRKNKARMAESLFSAVIRLRWGVEDPLCGLKGYRMDLYHSIGFFDRCRSTGTELMLRSLRLGYRARQIPVTVQPREGVSRFGSMVIGNLRILGSLSRVLPILVTSHR